MHNNFLLSVNIHILVAKRSGNPLHLLYSFVLTVCIQNKGCGTYYLRLVNHSMKYGVPIVSRLGNDTIMTLRDRPARIRYSFPDFLPNLVLIILAYS